jgi:acetyl-CoA C-acetyltransferase
MVAKQHMKLYGTTKEQLAMVSVKNRRNGLNNPKAQFREPITLETALTAKSIVPPLTLYDCCPITDGCAAVILASEEKARDLTDSPLVYIKGTGQATLNNMSANMPSWTTWEALTIAAKQAYESAGIGPDEIDVAQTHDCFTISEIIEYEDLGFCEKGEGGLGHRDHESAKGRCCEAGRRREDSAHPQPERLHSGPYGFDLRQRTVINGYRQIPNTNF